MHTLPVLQLFPFKGREPTPMDMAIAKHSGDPTPQARKFYSTRKVMKSLVEGDDEGNDARNSLERCLAESPVYTAWLKAMPDLMAIPALRGYRENREYQNRPQEVNDAIKLNGAILPPGQILFRGGTFDSSTSGLQEGLISTSLLPQVGHSHCGKSGFQFARFKTAPESRVVCVVFSALDESKFSHEAEVLIAGPITLRHTWSDKIGIVTLHEFEISHGFDV